ncbi:MAG: insulinase family protein [Erysipelotrichales bacterium]|nr:insulinase family protein [Erysipelotrichales bacterium]
MIKQETFLLKNKTRLVLSQDKSKNQTYAEIIIHYGSMNYKYQVGNKKYKIKEGIAHLLEHYIAENSIYGNLLEYLNESYVDFNAITSAKSTAFYINTVFDFEEHLKELIRIVNSPIFDSDRLETTKKPILEEIKKTRDRAFKKFSEKINYCTYRDTKFRETIGTEKTVNSITIADLKQVFKTFYQPANQTIFIAGNFDIKKISKLIEETYDELNIDNCDYSILDKKETARIAHKKGHVIDPEFDSVVNLSFKVDISSLTPKERVKATFYLSHFFDYNFNDGSKVYKELSQSKDTCYSITKSSSFFIKDLCIIDIGMYGTNVKKFKKLVFDVLKNKYADKEMFELWKKETLINLIIRENRVYTSGRAYLDNIETFEYFSNDSIEDIEKFSFSDYKEFLNKLDFSNYCVITQTKK